MMLDAVLMHTMWRHSFTSVLLFLHCLSFHFVNPSNVRIPILPGCVDIIQRTSCFQVGVAENFCIQVQYIFGHLHGVGVAIEIDGYESSLAIISIPLSIGISRLESSWQISDPMILDGPYNSSFLYNLMTKPFHNTCQLIEHFFNKRCSWEQRMKQSINNGSSVSVYQ